MAYHQRILFPNVPRKSSHIRAVASGLRPKYCFDFTSGTTFSKSPVANWPGIHPFQGQEIELRASAFATLARRPLRSEEEDWLRVALALYVADRCALRRPSGDRGATFWRRSIQVTLPVMDVKKWQDALPLILNALEFLTEDDWSIEFVKRTYHLEDEDQKIERIPKDTFSWVSLFSGGLDSAAGAIERLNKDNTSGLLLSGNTHSRLKAGQEDFIGTLRDQFPQRFSWLSVHYGFPIKLDEQGMDSSQRCRGWIHVAMGLLAAHLCGLDQLNVFENGIGAFNLPCDHSQFGSQTSRAMHPVFLHRIALAASSLLGHQLVVKNPCLFATKGEMVAKSSIAGLIPHLNETFSCDQFPNRHSSEDQCGVCPSCLVRKAALARLDGFDDSQGYTWNVLNQGIPPDLRLRTGLVKLGQFVERIEGWTAASDPWMAFLIDNPDYASWEFELMDILSLDPMTFRAQLLELHSRFSVEWIQFEQRIPRITKRKSAVLS
jgi:hypothetical protein